MKYFLRFVVVTLTFAGGVTLAHETAKEAVASARQKMKASDLAGAAQDAKEAQRLAGGDASQKADVLLLEGEIAEAKTDLPAAKALYTKLLEDASALPAQKWPALAKLAAILKTEKAFDAIPALYLQALDSKTFQNVPERVNVLLGLGQYHEANRSFVKAGEYYAQAAGLEPISRPHRFETLRALGKALTAQNKFEEARKQYSRMLDIPELTPGEKAGVILNLAGAYEEEGDFPKAREEFQKALQVEGLPPAGKKLVLAALSTFYKNRNDFPAFKETLATLRGMGGAVDGGVLRNYALAAEAAGKPDEEEAAWTEILATPDQPARVLLKPVSQKIQLLASRRDTEGLRKFLSSLDGYTLADGQRAFVNLLAAALAVPGRDWSQFKAPSLDPLDAAQQANAYFEVGKTMMFLNNHDGARFFAERGGAMFAKPVERLYKVPFLDQAPRGVAAWEASPLIKDASRREARFEEYNKQAAALLINDVNVARNVVADGTRKEAPVSFFMAADSLGWHVYLQYKDAEAEQVLAGLLGGAELEMYLQPGKGEAYYQFMMNVPTGKRQFVAWTSPNRHYRKLDDYLISEVAPIPGGFGIALTIPWELVYDKLPQPGDQWPFGVVDFGRSGAFTWGTGQVHELNRFGKVEFPDISKALPSIQRWIVLRAFAKFKKSAEAVRLTWGDPEKGDPEFYKSLVLPEAGRLQELGKLVSPKMTEADVKKLFREAVPAWMEFDYWVAEQRTRFLTDKLMAK